MEFRLKYEGPLKTNGSKNHKHAIRTVFHNQLKELWEHPPLKAYKEELDKDVKPPIFTKKVGDYRFAYIISYGLELAAEIDILLMRPEAPGKIISSGDIDNRLKTLFDALRCPNNSDELPTDIEPSNNEDPFFCLMEDDSLITRVTVTCDRLLESVVDPSYVFSVIHVKPKSIGNKKWIGLDIA